MVDRSNLGSLTSKALQEMLKVRFLPSSGNKRQRLERLQSDMGFNTSVSSSRLTQLYNPLLSHVMSFIGHRDRTRLIYNTSKALKMYLLPSMSYFDPVYQLLISCDVLPRSDPQAGARVRHHLNYFSIYVATHRRLRFHNTCVECGVVSRGWEECEVDGIVCDTCLVKKRRGFVYKKFARRQYGFTEFEMMNLPFKRIYFRKGVGFAYTFRCLDAYALLLYNISDTTALDVIRLNEHFPHTPAAVRKFMFAAADVVRLSN